MATYKHIRSSTANKRPTTGIADGQLAINTNTASPGLFFKDSAGTGIVKVGPVHVGTTAPNSTPASGGSTGNYLGEQWLDTSVSPAQLKVWNGSAWIGVVADELPVSKLQDGTARQLIQTDAAGTGVEWTSNIDVPGTLDVTSTATFDSIASHPLGTAGAPTITFTGDTNTGIYSPGADQVAISTNGTGRVFVAAGGNVGIGTSSPVAILSVKPTSEFSTAVSTFTGDGLFIGSANAAAGSGNYGPGIAWPSLGSDANRQAGICSHQGTADPNQVGLSFFTHPSGTSSDPIVETVRISYDGKVGIGIASPGSALEINAATATSPFIAKINTAEAARIDSSGRLLVGTSTNRTSANHQVEGTTASASSASFVRNSNSASAGSIILGKSRGATTNSYTAVLADDTLGTVQFTGADGTNDIAGAWIQAQVDGTPGTSDMPGRLVFSTTADGASSPTERMRIDSNGFARYTGAIGRGAPVTKTGAFTVGIAENWLICNGTASITVTLPTASAWTGREIMLKTIAAFTVVSASSNVVPLAGGAAGTAILAATAGKYATLVSDGTNWIVMQAN